jgi:LysM repeat protein
MVKFRGVVLGLLLAAAAHAQNLPVDLANLREDVRGLSQRVAELSLRLEQVEAENRELRGKAGAAEKNFVTLSQLNDSVADLNRTIKSATGTAKTETLQQVATQIDRLAKQTNAAIDALAKNMATRPVVQTFAEDFPKEGVSYTVLKGDSLASIAKKTGGKQQDIINANKISDPSKIQVGQTLFIPGGK